MNQSYGMWWSACDKAAELAKAKQPPVRMNPESGAYTFESRPLWNELRLVPLAFPCASVAVRFRPAVPDAKRLDGGGNHTKLWLSLMCISEPFQ
jgi:hypothetical protein